LSRPEIALQKKSKAMEERFKSLYIKRTQRDYPLSFKMAIVREVESGAIGNRAAMRKYGIQGHGTITEWRRMFHREE
jgi:transposase-like protein